MVHVLGSAYHWESAESESGGVAFQRERHKHEVVPAREQVLAGVSAEGGRPLRAVRMMPILPWRRDSGLAWPRGGTKEPDTASWIRNSYGLRRVRVRR